MRDTLSPGCKPVFLGLDPRNPVLMERLQAGGAVAWLDDDGWLVWCTAGKRANVVHAAELKFTWQGRARYITANALAVRLALHGL